MLQPKHILLLSLPFVSSKIFKIPILPFFTPERENRKTERQQFSNLSVFSPNCFLAEEFIQVGGCVQHFLEEEEEEEQSL